VKAPTGVGDVLYITSILSAVVLYPLSLYIQKLTTEPEAFPAILKAGVMSDLTPPPASQELNFAIPAPDCGAHVGKFPVVTYVHVFVPEVRKFVHPVGTTVPELNPSEFAICPNALTDIKRIQATRLKRANTGSIFFIIRTLDKKIKIWSPKIIKK
jgi:hypothetical protein